MYQKENGEVPVKEFINSLVPKLRAKTIRDIELLEEHGFALKEPYVKMLRVECEKPLYELRIKFATDIARIIYFVYERNTFILLNGFVKKTNKTPHLEINRAIQYMRDYIRRQ